MQNSMWKLATLLGVIGVGCLVIMQVQKNLAPENVQASKKITPAGEAVPSASQSDDLFAGLSDMGSSPFTADQYEPPAGNDIAQASYEPPAQDDFGAADNSIAFADSTSTTNFSDPSPPPGQERQPVGDFFGDGFEDATDAVSKAATNAKSAFTETAQDVGGFVEDGFDAVADKAADLLESPAQPDLFDPDNNNDPGFDVRTAAAPQELPSTDAAFGDAPLDAMDDPLGGALGPDPAAAMNDDMPGFGDPSIDAGFGGDDFSGEVFDPNALEMEPRETGRASLSLDAPSQQAPELPDFNAQPEPSQEPVSFGSYEDETTRPAPPADTINDYPEMGSTGQATYDTRVRALPAVDTRIQGENGTVTESKDGIRVTGGRYNKSYDSVPHGTLQPQLRIEKSAPGSASIGKPLVYSIKIRNVGNAVANEVIVEDQIPRNTSLTGTIPQAELVDNILVWRFPTLGPNEEKTIKIRVVPEREGQIGSVATVNFKAEIGAQTTVTAPRLRFEMATQQPEARVGETVAFRYTVTNIGSGDASNVWIQNQLPSQLQHPEGDNIEYQIGDLPAGKSQTVTLQLVAAGPGDILNPAIVTADGHAKTPARAKINILGAQLEVTRRGPKRRYLGRTGVYENIVRNITRRDAESATLIEYVPRGMKLVNVDNNGQWNELKRTITWSVPRIRAGESLSFKAVLSPETAGSHESLVHVIEQAGFKSKKVSLTTQVVHLDNMGLNLSELDGPVAIGERVVFTLNVRNRGTSTATRSVLMLEFPRELQVLEAGPLTAREDPKGGIVRFDPVDAIPPGGEKRFQIAFKATGPVSNARLRASIQSDQMQRGLVTEEAITIYDEDRP